MTSGVSMVSSPSFHSFDEPQQGHFSGAATTTRSRQMIEKRFVGRALALEGLRSKPLGFENVHAAFAVQF